MVWWQDDGPCWIWCTMCPVWNAAWNGHMRGWRTWINAVPTNSLTELKWSFVISSHNTAVAKSSQQREMDCFLEMSPLIQVYYCVPPSCETQAILCNLGSAWNRRRNVQAPLCLTYSVSKINVVTFILSHCDMLFCQVQYWLHKLLQLGCRIRKAMLITIIAYSDSDTHTGSSLPHAYYCCGAPPFILIGASWVWVPIPPNTRLRTQVPSLPLSLISWARYGWV